MARARVIRGANFAYPYSERHEFYSPRIVRILVGISGMVVILLVLLPFYLQYLRQQTLQRATENTALLAATRYRAEQARPVIRQMAYLDSIKQLLDARLELYSRVEAVEYRMDRLLLHITDIMPDGAVLSSIDIRPPQQRRGGRAIRATETEDVPEELQNALVVTLNGSARNSEVLSSLREAMNGSPLFDAVKQDVTVLEQGISFTLTARLPGSGASLEEGAP